MSQIQEQAVNESLAQHAALVTRSKVRQVSSDGDALRKAVLRRYHAIMRSLWLDCWARFFPGVGIDIHELCRYTAGVSSLKSLSYRDLQDLNRKLSNQGKAVRHLDIVLREYDPAENLEALQSWWAHHANAWGTYPPTKRAVLWILKEAEKMRFVSDGGTP